MLSTLIKGKKIKINKFILLLYIFLTISNGVQANATDIFSLSLEELMQVTVQRGTLIHTDVNKIPASITTITEEQIRLSGARSLDELLDIYVPGFQYMLKAQGNQMGIRGTITDRNTKMMMLVNGRNMNIKGRDGGALTERHLSMLGDIKSITIIRGPGSAVYGPGAIAGIINIETKIEKNAEGLQVSIRAGRYEEFYNAEFQYSKTLENGLKMYGYYGIDDYDGADQNDSPLIFSHGFTAGGDNTVVANKPVPFHVSNHNGSYKFKQRHKAHFQLSNEQVNLWARYTRSGQQSTPVTSVFMDNSPESLLDIGHEYQQLTFFSNFSTKLSDKTAIKYTLSYDQTDIQTSPDFYWREDEYYAQFLTNMNFSTQHKLAFGGEISHELHGKESKFRPNQPSNLNPDIPAGTEWDTTMYSLLLEHQWSPDHQWLLITGGRLDKHDLTPWMFAPRVGLTYTSDNSDNYKYIYNRSVRRSDDIDLYRGELLGGNEGTTEYLDNFEFRFEKKKSGDNWFALSAYFNDHSVVSWDGDNESTNSLGKLKTYGLEVEWLYKFGDSQLSISHNYSNHFDFDLDRNTSANNLSVSPYNYGDDLINWSNHSTKMSIVYKFNPNWILSSSLRIYWGYPGGIDLADYNREQLNSRPNLAHYDNTTQAFEERFYLNMGLEHRISKDTIFRIDGHNLLGILDDQHNKRNFFQRIGKHNIEAPAISASFSTNF